MKSTRKSPQAQFGFTLVEILVALLILGAALDTIMVGLSMGTTESREASHVLVSLAIAKSLLATQDDPTVQTVGERSGITGDHYVWDITTKPWPVGSGSVERLIGAYWIQVVVTHAGRSVTLTTLRAGAVTHQAD